MKKILLGICSFFITLYLIFGFFAILKNLSSYRIIDGLIVAIFYILLVVLDIILLKFTFKSKSKNISNYDDNTDYDKNGCETNCNISMENAVLETINENIYENDNPDSIEAQKTRFSLEYGDEFDKIINESLEQCFEVSDYDEIDDKIKQCKKAIKTFDDLKTFCYSKGEGGIAYYEDELNFMKETDDAAYSMQVTIRENLEDYLKNYDKYKKMGDFYNPWRLIDRADSILKNMEGFEIDKINNVCEILNEALNQGNTSNRLSLLLKQVGDICYNNDLKNKALFCYENGLKINNGLGVKRRIKELKN